MNKKQEEELRKVASDPNIIGVNIRLWGMKKLLGVQLVKVFKKHIRCKVWMFHLHMESKIKFKDIASIHFIYKDGGVAHYRKFDEEEGRLKLDDINKYYKAPGKKVPSGKGSRIKSADKRERVESK